MEAMKGKTRTRTRTRTTMTTMTTTTMTTMTKKRMMSQWQQHLNVSEITIAGAPFIPS
jgi:hypothetical protein